MCIRDSPNTARKYEIGGTSNYAGAIALGESLGLVNEIGIENIQQRVWEIGEYCMDRWEEIGGTVITHRDPGRRGGIIITRLYPVSYTHLDVYKRQVLGDRALNLQRAHKDAEEMELLREASRMNDRVMALSLIHI